MTAHIVVTDVRPVLGGDTYLSLPPGRVVGCAPGRVPVGHDPILQVWQEVPAEYFRGPKADVGWVLYVLRAGSPAPVLPLTREWAWQGVGEFAHQAAAIYLRRSE